MVALGLTKAKVIDLHRSLASRLYIAFVDGKLEQKWSLDSADYASLKVRENLRR